MTRVGPSAAVARARAGAAGAGALATRAAGLAGARARHPGVRVPGDGGPLAADHRVLPGLLDHLLRLGWSHTPACALGAAYRAARRALARSRAESTGRSGRRRSDSRRGSPRSWCCRSSRPAPWWRPRGDDGGSPGTPTATARCGWPSTRRPARASSPPTGTISRTCSSGTRTIPIWWASIRPTCRSKTRSCIKLWRSISQGGCRRPRGQIRETVRLAVRADRSGAQAVRPSGRRRPWHGGGAANAHGGRLPRARWLTAVLARWSWSHSSSAAVGLALAACCWQLPTPRAAG